MHIYLVTQDDDEAVVVAPDSGQAKALAGFRDADCVVLGLPEHAVGRVILKNCNESRWFYHANDTVVVARGFEEAKRLSGYTNPKRLCSSNLEVGVL